MISRPRAASTVTRRTRAAMRRRARRVRRLVCRRSCVLSAATGRRVIITMRSPARAAKVSFAAASLRMPSTVANSAGPVRWTCIWDASARSVDWRNVWPLACGRNALYRRISAPWSGVRRRPKGEGQGVQFAQFTAWHQLQFGSCHRQRSTWHPRLRQEGDTRSHDVWGAPACHNSGMSIIYRIMSICSNYIIYINLQLLPDDILAECQARNIPPLTFNQLAVIYKLIWYQDGYEQPSEEDLKRIMVSVKQKTKMLSISTNFQQS